MEMGQYAEGETAQDIFRDSQTRVRKTSAAPILKDTIAVPSDGYAIIKFKANNPGKLFYSKINIINRK
jgi:FtsP/CotA-like multicopper oxidase with cupredoxin domain